MAIGRISGPMLFSNLDRQGVDLAFESNLLYLDVTNSRVGVLNDAPQYSLDVSGNVKIANLVITHSAIRANTGKLDLGSTSNFTISGGSENYVLYTDGTGNLAWGQISDLDATWGNILIANNTVSITSTNGNLNLQANGTGSIVTTNNLFVANIQAELIAAEVLLANSIVLTGNVSAPYLLGNTVGTTLWFQSGIIGTGNSTVWYTQTLNSDSGNIATLVTNNFVTANANIASGNVTATITGNVTGNFATFTGNVNADWATANIAGYYANFAEITGTNVFLSGSSITTTMVDLQDITIVGNTVTSTNNDLVFAAAVTDPNNIIRFDSVSAIDIAAGTNEQRPPAPSVGYLRYNTDFNTIEWWSGADWTQATQVLSLEAIYPDGVSLVYTLGQSTTTSSILVNINGTIQQAGSGAYSVTDNQITFAEAPQVSDVIEIRYMVKGGFVTSIWSGGNVANVVSFSSNVQSTSANTGAVTIVGGLGVAGNINVGGNIGVATTTGTPSNTTSPASWLKVYVGDVQYYMPLYQ